MKKSKFLQSSKDMISRSFNPAKCKTSLRLAESRLKLLRNKKEVQVKQMKREIAQLLESGQDRTARIRVEHVVREEKMMAAYDLIEIYCELIVARLPIIESQKTCPIDLKEAISSVIFASPRCGDVPELLDVRKQLTAKYGKEFTTAAVELRPACGVGRMLIEKLSTAAPDGQAKIKILTAIADEHNIKWDPSSLEEKESVPANDLLNGPNNLKKESNVYAEPSRFEAPDVQAPPGRNNIQIPPPNFQQEDPRISLGAEKLAHTGVSTTVQPNDRPAALGVRRSQQFQEDGDTFSPGRHRFRMEFKDATSAAQAAADSAELASMAARAAAELSSGGRISRQYSTESNKSDVYVLKNEGPEPYSPSKFNKQKNSEEHMDRLLYEHTMLQNEQKDSTKASNLKTERKSKEDDYDGTKAYNNSASLKSKASTGDDFLDHSGSAVDGYSRKNSLKGDSRGEMRVNKQSFSYDAEGGDNWVEKSENFREERIGKESINSSRSHSGISDDVNIFATAAGEDTSVASGKEQVNEKASQKSMHESASLFYEKNDSDSEDHGFDLGPQYDEQDLEFHLPSPSKAKDHFSINKESWYPGSSASKIVKSDPSLFFTTKNSPPDLSENLTVTHGSELDDFMPVAFDDSDGPTFESDEDMNMSRHRRNRDSSNLPSKHKESRQPVVSPYNEKERSGSDRKQFPQSYDDELKHAETPEVRNQGKNIDADPAENFSLGKPSMGNPDLGFKEEKYQVEPIVFDQERSPDRGEGLKFEKLTGGLRHKGHRHRPYLKNHLDESSSAKEETISSSAFVAESPKKSRVSDHKKNTRRSKLNYDLSSDSSEEEDFPLKKVGNTEKEVKTESRFRASNSVFDSDSDFEEDARKGYPVSVKPHLRGGISRRTKASPSSPGANSYSNMRVRAEALDSGAGMDRKPKSSFMSEAAIEPDKSGHLENYEQSTSLKPASRPAKSSYWGPPEQSNSPKTAAVIQGRAQGKSYLPDSEASAGSKQTNSYSPETQEEVFPPRRKSSQVRNPEQPKKEKTSLATVQESKISLKSSELEEPSISKLKKEVSSSGSEKPKATTFNKSDSSKASHVHPKLPDYDMLLQSFQRNRP